MLYVFVILLILTSIIQSIKRTDCYQTFSTPIIYIKLSHYFPCGPAYLSIIFEYQRFQNITGNYINQILNKETYRFKRIDVNCTPSPLFTTLGKNFRRIKIQIHLQLDDFHGIMASIKYSFYNGFKPGFYEMFDIHKIFALYTQFLDVEERYLKYRKEPYDIINSYLESISGINNDLCVITENNRAVVLTPISESKSRHGYITNLYAEIFRYKGTLDKQSYPAYECNKDDKYPRHNIMFIIEDESININLYIYDRYLNKKEIILNNYKFDFVYRLENINKKYTKVFLLNHVKHLEKCPDGSFVWVYRSEYKIPYFAGKHNKFNVSNGVQATVDFYFSPFDVCGEKNEPAEIA